VAPNAGAGEVKLRSLPGLTGRGARGCWCREAELRRAHRPASVSAPIETLARWCWSYCVTGGETLLLPNRARVGLGGALAGVAGPRCFFLAA